jgi:16S rRNA (cytosine967-C5)-methyltransferase
MKEREIALYAITDILGEKGYNNIVLRKTLNKNKQLSVVQRGFVTELVNGTLRNLIHIDYIISSFSKTPLPKVKPMVLNTLRLAVYQLVYMDKVPDSAACNEAVALIKKKGLAGLSGYVNGVLRNVARNKDSVKYPDEDKEPVKFLSVKYSYPEWIIEYWLKSFDYDKVKLMCAENNLAPRVGICINTCKTNREELKAALARDNIAVTDGCISDDSLCISKTSDISEAEAYGEGLFHIMDESSMLAVKILDPHRGDTVMDVCAAPGGKSFYCGYLMGNEGKIISGDVHEHKIELLREGAQRLGLDCIAPTLADASVFNEKYAGTADRLIADAPCSGLGLVKKKPDIKYNKTYDDIESLVKIQRDILTASAAYVKKGGYLVYSTCTVSSLENEENVKWFLNNFDFESVDISNLLPSGLTCDTAKDGYVQILPGDFGTDGFFIAKFVRKN